MMKVQLTREAAVRLPAGTVIEVTEREAKRLRAFRLAVPEEEKPKKKAAKKK